MERERKGVDLKGLLVSKLGTDIMQPNLNEHRWTTEWKVIFTKCTYEDQVLNMLTAS